MKVSYDELILIIADALNCRPETLTENSGLGHHEEWDSLGHVTIMVSLEEHYNVTIDETNIAQLNTVKKILEFLNARAI